VVGLAGAFTSAKTYALIIDPNIFDCAGNSLSPVSKDGKIHPALNYELCLLSFTNTIWRMNTNGIDLGTAWRSDPAYDDRNWPTGVGAFDGF
jgi:hypothetical protein